MRMKLEFVNSCEPKEINASEIYDSKLLASSACVHAANAAITSYFFCCTSLRGTEGIRRVENSVAFLAPYRATFQGNKQAMYHFK